MTEDLIGKSIADITHPDEAARDMGLLKRMYETGEPFVVDKRYVRPENSIVWVLNSVTPIRDAGGKIIGGFTASIDVTERKRAEEALRQSEARRAFLLEFGDSTRSLNDPLAIITAAAEMLGRQLNAGRVGYAEVNLKHRVYAKGLNLELDDLLRINPRSRKKQAVDPLATGIRIWQTAFETSRFAQLAVGFNGCLVMANAQANALFGLTLKELGHPLQTLKPGQLVSSHTSIKQLCSDRRPATLKNVEYRTPDRTTYLDVSITPVFSSDGHLLAMNLTFTDTTGDKQLEDKLEHAHSELARVSKRLEETKAALDATRTEFESTQKELKTVYQEMQFFQQDLRRN